MEANEPRPLVSVIITTYNRAHLVSRAIDSVLNQLYDAVEIIVVDDGSTDNTDEILQRYRSEPRVRMIRLPVNRGVTAAKNTGLDTVRGEFTTILDSDDELLPDAIVALVNAFVALGSTYGMVFANGVDPHTQQMTGLGLSGAQEVTYKDAITGGFSGDFLGLWRTSLLATLRFDERVPGRESLVWHRLYRITRVHYLHKPIANFYRDGADRISRPVADPERARRIALGYQLYIDEFGADLRKVDSRRFSRQLQAMAFWLLIAGQSAEALNALFRAVVAAPRAVSIALLATPVVPRKILWSLVQGRFK